MCGFFYILQSALARTSFQGKAPWSSAWVGAEQRVVWTRGALGRRRRHSRLNRDEKANEKEKKETPSAPVRVHLWDRQGLDLHARGRGSSGAAWHCTATARRCCCTGRVRIVSSSVRERRGRGWRGRKTGAEDGSGRRTKVESKQIISHSVISMITTRVSRKNSHKCHHHITL